MHVTYLSAPSGSGGVSSYTDRIVSAVPFEADRREVRSRLNPVAYLRLAYALSRSDTDVVHVQFVYNFFGPKGSLIPVFFPALYLLSRRSGTRIVVTFHEVWHRGVIGDSSVEMLYVRAIHGILKSTTDRIVFLSHVGKCRFGDVGVVMPHGVDLENTRSYGEAEAKERFGYRVSDTVVAQIGYVNYRKNVEAFLELAEAFAEVEFLLAGGPRTPEFEPLFEELERRAPSNCQLTGVLDPEAFHMAFVAADVVVLPYTDIIQSGIFNWCAAYGCVVLASDIRYFNDIDERWDCLETFSDTANGTTTLRRLLSDDERRSYLSARMTRYAEHNSLERIGEQYRSLYAELCRDG